MDVQFVGNSQPIKQIKELIKVVVNTGLSVIIYGETGAGKEVVARELHRLSARRRERFVKVNCAALPSELLESELFGYEQGAFTGALRFKPGKFEIASDGVMFLDEIGDMPLSLQAKLLHVLQSGEFSRLGGDDVKVNTWIIAATNHDLASDMRDGAFREDLYYRLNIIKIDVPPLRERREDIPMLVEHFIKKNRSDLDIQEEFTIDQELINLFLEYDWPGNIRELSNAITRLMVLGDRDEIRDKISQSARIPPASDKIESHGESSPETKGIVPLREIRTKARDYIEKRIIDHALKMAGSNKAKAARRLNISYKALFYKMKNLGLE